MKSGTQVGSTNEFRLARHHPKTTAENKYAQLMTIPPGVRRAQAAPVNARLYRRRAAVPAVIDHIDFPDQPLVDHAHHRDASEAVKPAR
eukprot:CAMPEP_0114604836 /NCGR_PEP_ID=MMETSP0168-20121206/749_1 /TAXON_ID=95228 ORGANISM="Vannella sp., Strain DIVA3 517/6/12" /NCGR_SAMPLE_ID=MMETSP0168 /ASSEMBLY_ACC=CAM_ASM_000044 /LENGTH=88 /DNA_ID=CAMNT_0001815677 /DNA_START=444 /DNA_END=710 /DNA_ORIENTATION=+